MKKIVLSLGLIFGSSMALAGSFSASDFNEMIKENQSSEAQLRTHLQKEAGIQLDQEKPGTIAKDKLEIPQEAEQIVVNSSRSFWDDKKDNSQSLIDKVKMKRLSQELKESSR